MSTLSRTAAIIFLEELLRCVGGRDLGTGNTEGGNSATGGESEIGIVSHDEHLLTCILKPPPASIFESVDIIIHLQYNIPIKKSGVCRLCQHVRNVERNIQSKAA